MSNVLAVKAVDKIIPPPPPPTIKTKVKWIIILPDCLFKIDVYTNALLKNTLNTGFNFAGLHTEQALQTDNYRSSFLSRF